METVSFFGDLLGVQMLFLDNFHSLSINIGILALFISKKKDYLNQLPNGFQERLVYLFSGYEAVSVILLNSRGSVTQTWFLCNGKQITQNL